ncbi:MAG: hypothetical protein M1378_04970 [Bacteroidetes bacterium]|nr:hypothetical protein [Bacteroidota bacterium]
MKVQKAIETAKKISTQTEALQKMQKNREELRRRVAGKRMMRAQQNDRIVVLGRESNFLKAPPALSKKAISRMMKVSLASPVLIDGKQSDTVEVGQPYDLTFSFSPGFVSAVMNVYVDADSNGVVSDGDIKIYENVLLLDNESSDADPAQGSYRLRLTDNYVLNHIACTLIFEINDYQSVGTSLVTLKQPYSPTVIEGSIIPPLPDIIVELHYGGKDLYVCTDSSGKFSANIVSNPPYSLSAYFYDLPGNCWVFQTVTSCREQNRSLALRIRHA